MIKASDVAKGTFILINNQPHVCVEREYVNPGKGSAFVRLKLKNIKTGAVLRQTNKVQDNLEDVSVEFQEVQFLYADNENYAFMDTQTYEQFTIAVAGRGGEAGLPQGRGELPGRVLGSRRRSTSSFPPRWSSPSRRRRRPSAGDTVSGATKVITCETGPEGQGAPVHQAGRQDPREHRDPGVPGTGERLTGSAGPLRAPGWPRRPPRGGPCPRSSSSSPSAHFFNDIYMGFLTPLYPIIMDKFGLSLSAGRRRLHGRPPWPRPSASRSSACCSTASECTASAVPRAASDGGARELPGRRSLVHRVPGAPLPRLPRLRRVPPQGRLRHADALGQPPRDRHGRLQRRGQPRLRRGTRRRSPSSSPSGDSGPLPSWPCPRPSSPGRLALLLPRGRSSGHGGGPRESACAALLAQPPGPRHARAAGVHQLLPSPWACADSARSCPCTWRSRDPR